MSHDTWTVSIPFPVAVDRSQLQIHPSSAVRSRLQPGGRPLPGWVTCAFGFLQLLLVAWHLIWLVNVGTGMGWFGGGSMGRISNSLALGMSVWLAPQSTSKYLKVPGDSGDSPTVHSWPTLPRACKARVAHRDAQTDALRFDGSDQQIWAWSPSGPIWGSIWQGRTHASHSSPQFGEPIVRVPYESL